VIIPHHDDYRPPRRRSTAVAWFCLLAGAGVIIAGTIWLAIRWVTWLLR